MLTKLPFAFCLLLLTIDCTGQVPQEKEWTAKIASARTTADAVYALGELAELYSVFRDNKRADSVLAKQMLLAETAQDEELILKTLSGNTIDNLAIWSDKATFDRATAFLQKALVYAKEQNNPQLEALTYLKLAKLNRKRQQFEPALEQATLAFLLLDKKQDSLKSALYLELGEAFAGKGDAVAAYKNYNSAYDLAYSLGNLSLQTAAWHSFANLYKNLGDTQLAKNALAESLRLNEKHRNRRGLLADYMAFAKLTAEQSFIDKALTLAAELHSVRDLLQAKRLQFSYIMVVEKNSTKALAYLQQNPDLDQYTRNNGLPNYNIGAVYHYSGQNAEAVRNYLLDEPLILSSYDPSVQLSYYNEVGDCHAQLAQTDKAIAYYEKAFALSKTIGNAAGNASLTLKLAQLFAQNNDYKRAYEYNQLHLGYNETLKQLAKEREVTLLGLEREKKKHEKDLAAAAEQNLKRRNLQYTGISMAIALLFIALVLFGMFPVSRVTVRMLNFVSFICLFEFIILLIDNWLHDLTHGEPLKIWLAKIVIIGLLLPLHHTLEHVTVKFLSSQKLQQFRERISVRRMFHPSKKTVEKIEENLEESTLV